AAVVEGLAIPGVKLDGPVEILDRPVVLALSAVGEAALREGRTIFGIELDRSVEVLDRPVVLAFHPVCAAAIRENGRKKFGIARTGRYDDRAAFDLQIDILILRAVLERSGPCGGRRKGQRDAECCAPPHDPSPRASSFGRRLGERRPAKNPLAEKS